MTRLSRTSGLFLALMVVLGGLAACSGNPYQLVRPQVASSPDKASLMLAEAADRASVSLETLAAVEQARSPGIAVAPIADAPPELMRAMTISWQGPVEPLVRKLSDRAGYGFDIVGAPPPVGIVVNVNVESTPIIDILRSVGLQLGVRADLRVDSQSQMVEIHYAPVTGIGE